MTDDIMNGASQSWRALSAAMETYRDEIDELQQANWNGNVLESLRRIRALADVSRTHTTEELEALVRLPRS